MLIAGATRMAAEGSTFSDVSGRRPFVPNRRRVFLLVAVISALIHHSRAQFDDSADWTYGISSDVDWRPSDPVAAAAQADVGTSGAASPWWRQVNAMYSRHHRKSQSHPRRRFITGSAWKRRSTYRGFLFRVSSI